MTTANQVAWCSNLRVIEADGKANPVGGVSGCGWGDIPPGETTPPSVRQVAPSISLGPWQAPSGANYVVISGQGIPGVARVSLADGSGVVAASAPATPAAYVVFIPADKFTNYSRLVFTNKAGKVLYSQNENS